MLAAIVDTKGLWQTVVASLVAGVGITALYSVMVFASVRATDMRRDERSLAAAALGLLALLGLVATVAAVALGIVVMTSK